MPFHINDFIFISNSFLFIAFDGFAEYIEQPFRKVLTRGGFRYYRYGEESSTKIYWRCAGYYRSRCPCRATTSNINGKDVVKFSDTAHNHMPPEN